MIKKAPLFLLAANILLLVAGWIMAIYAYPRLPLKIPLWINFFNQRTLYGQKSLLFFIYPLAQTLFFFSFWLVSRIKFKELRDVKLLVGAIDNLSENKRSLLIKIRQEFIYLVLIFFNLIFIHLQRSLILVAHRIEKGISSYYFYALFGIILILIPYYRIRMKLVMKKR